ncbi:hypothetical protein C1752_01116 [Acaryochloris thomasi RCC1774]|uniref:Tetratricopeptide repeat protein n=1 Tax=Acaryochloris thomasi RCC1774 TaxID=1764569 RepID=A0A2W1JTF7_9CYAN|nr:hypothetical protein [Acaryochloris thomasi]PZD74375.1 hypothetical protein C1752_01116 [Acaryochloris thomasi RCC1774]
MNSIFDQIPTHLDLPSEDQLPHSQAAEFYYRRGLRHEFLGLIQSAIEAYNFAILQDPTHANAYFSRGSLLKSSNICEALQDLAKASDLYFEQMNCENHRKAKLALETLRIANRLPKNTALQPLRIETAAIRVKPAAAG